MNKSLSSIALAIAALGASTALAQSSPKLDGIWRTEDQSATVRVGKCPASANWCATVIDERLAQGEPSKLNQTIVRDMRPKGTQGWVGQYVVDGQSMKASAKLANPTTLAFKVCAFAFLCDTIRLNRVRGE
ncbi:MAG: hypothetical protein ACKVOJ_01195 [Sphingomonadaceae bacterium]